MTLGDGVLLAKATREDDGVLPAKAAREDDGVLPAKAAREDGVAFQEVALGARLVRVGVVGLPNWL